MVTQKSSSSPCGQSFFPSHSWACGRQIDEYRHRTDGLAQTGVTGTKIRKMKLKGCKKKVKQKIKSKGINILPHDYFSLFFSGISLLIWVKERLSAAGKDVLMLLATVKVWIMIRLWDSRLFLTCADLAECSNYTQHLTSHRYALEDAPVTSVPQSQDIIGTGQEEWLWGSYDRACDVPPPAGLMASFLQQT